MGEQKVIGKKGHEGRPGHCVLRSTDARKKVGFSTFAGIRLPIMKHDTNGNEVETPTRKSRLQSQTRLTLQAAQSTPREDSESSSGEITTETISRIELALSPHRTVLKYSCCNAIGSLKIDINTKIRCESA